MKWHSGHDLVSRRLLRWMTLPHMNFSDGSRLIYRIRELTPMRDLMSTLGSIGPDGLRRCYNA